MRLAEVALGVAIGALGEGVKEEGGENQGDTVRKYLWNAGIAVPAPWCAAAIQMWSDVAARIQGAKNPLDDVKREALVADYVSLAESRGWIVPVESCARGDLVCFRFGDSGRWNHIGIVMDPPEAYGPDRWGKIQTIEGNTNDEGSREGEGVHKKFRTYLPGRVCFIRWDDEGLEAAA